MPAIFLQESLSPQESFQLKREFPHYTLLTSCSESEWSTVEVLFGGELSEEELKQATRLRWIHCPTADTDGLSLPEIQRREDITITLTKGQNVAQMAEYVIGGILAHAKQFFHWPQAPSDPKEFLDWPLKETMWTLRKKILLQIGLGEVGTAIVKQANELGMKSWGIRREHSFHPYCHKTYSARNLHSLLPAADVVSIALPRGAGRELLFGREEFELMKPDSIFVVIGSGDRVDEKSLAEIAQSGKFRGLLLDVYNPPKDSPLRTLPNVLLTPSVASYPQEETHAPFRLLRTNLRLFVPGNLTAMKNRLEL